MPCEHPDDLKLLDGTGRCGICSKQGAIEYGPAYVCECGLKKPAWLPFCFWCMRKKYPPKEE